MQKSDPANQIEPTADSLLGFRKRVGEAGRWFHGGGWIVVRPFLA